MAIIKCSECGGEVSDRATACPHCGNPISIDSAIGIGAPRESISLVSEERKGISFARSAIIIIASFLCFLLIFAMISSRLPAKSFFNVAFQGIAERLGRLNGGISSIRSTEGVASEEIDPLIPDGGLPGTVFNPAQRRVNLAATPSDSLRVQSDLDGSKIYPVQSNDLWGRQFYTSKIDSTGSVDIGSELKQIIARVLINASFPTELSRRLIVVSVDPTVVRSNDKVQIPWSVSHGSFTALQPEGGLYVSLAGEGGLIYLNNSSIRNKATLVHELGHHIGYRLTDEEWDQYYKLRGIPVGTPRNMSTWNLSPHEDFAEVYKNSRKKSFEDPVGPSSGQWDVKTVYGVFVYGSSLGDFGSACFSSTQEVIDSYLSSYLKNNPTEIFIPTSVQKKAESYADLDKKVQDCRKKNNAPSPFGGMLYVSRVDSATEKFVNTVLSRLGT